MSRWALWRKRRATAQAPLSAPDHASASRRRLADFSGAADVVSTVFAWLLPSGAVVVGALGQFMLALVLLTLAFGVWLRLWRGRKKRHAAF